MRTLIYKCVNCGRYTLRKDKCMYCGGELKSAHPPNISIHSKLLSLIIRERRKEGRVNINQRY